MAPAPDNERPGGSEAVLTLQLYGGVPPDAVTLCEYACPTVPAGRDVVVIVTVEGATVMRSGCVAD